MTTGYSGTPLAKKLGFKPGVRALAIGAPENYRDLLDPLPEDIIWVDQLETPIDLIHVFSKERHQFEDILPDAIDAIRPAGMIWASWPKKAAKIPTDVTEDVIRDIALPLGLVDVKVCAIDATWSGLKLVIRKENR